MEDNKNTTGSVGFIGLLQIAFIVLKLCKVIDWKWLWVLAPTWLAWAIAIVIAIIAVTIKYFRGGYDH